MRVLGIDCGGQYTGYGVVEEAPEGVLVCVAAGAVRLRTRDPLSVRLLHVYQELQAVIQRYQPAVAAIEGVFATPIDNTQLEQKIVSLLSKLCDGAA